MHIEGAKILVANFVSANESHLFVMDASSGARERLTPESKERVAWGAGVFGNDPQMVARAEAKAAGRGGMTFVVADTTRLPFPDAAFDVATVGFGVRIVDNLPRALAELCRVLRPGGRVAILDITRPRGLLAPFYRIWFDVLIPLAGRLLPGGAAYVYLPASVRRFPGPTELSGLLRQAGFIDVRYRLFGGGIVALLVGEAA